LGPEALLLLELKLGKLDSYAVREWPIAKQR
jgi:hypothetical protein